MNITNVVIGYFIFINILSLALLWFDVRTSFWKWPEKKKIITYLVITLLGGGFALLLGAEMFQYKKEEKWMKYLIPLITFLEAVALAYIVIKVMGN